MLHGWITIVVGLLLIIAQPPPPDPLETLLPLLGEAVTVGRTCASGAINVRAQPDRGAAVLTQIRTAQAIEMLERAADGNWYRVRYPDPADAAQRIEGWISAEVICRERYVLPRTVAPEHFTHALAYARSFSGSNADWIPISAVMPADPIGKTMVLVPTGEFTMGSASGEDDEQPAHPQRIDTPFWIDQTEITRADYQACVAANQCLPLQPNDESNAPDQPINHVTWFMADNFCRWRGMTLPTERQWEFAARGPAGWDYPWGNDWDQTRAAWWGNTYVSVPVGSYPNGASWVGALDMSGNIWEWTTTIYDNDWLTGEFPYPYVEDDGRENLERVGIVRSLRGGSFLFMPFYLRTTDRIGSLPDFGGNVWGMRCVHLSE